jgi:hypothetical protein
VVESTYTKLLRYEKSAPLVMLRHSLCKYVMLKVWFVYGLIHHGLNMSVHPIRVMPGEM